MKRFLLMATLVFSSLAVIHPSVAMAYNFGDFRSETLATKAWGALNEGDIEAVLAYTNKCIELYGEQARKMQDSLDTLPVAKESNDEVFAFWALNDVATSLFIQGEAYRNANMKEEAIEVYQQLVDEYKYGQSWDTKGWFWQPSASAQEKIDMLKSGSEIDFGDYTSSFITTQAWNALEKKDLNTVLIYTNKVKQLFDKQATEMQESLTEYPWESKQEIFSFWALNDIGTSLYIKGSAYQKAGMKEEAKEAFKTLVDEYYYAQCWDPNGWFWKPAEAAQQSLDELEDM